MHSFLYRFVVIIWIFTESMQEGFVRICQIFKILVFHKYGQKATRKETSLQLPK